MSTEDLYGERLWPTGAHGVTGLKQATLRPIGDFMAGKLLTPDFAKPKESAYTAYKRNREYLRKKKERDKQREERRQHNNWVVERLGLRKLKNIPPKT